MTKNRALQITNNILIAAQRGRSITREEMLRNGYSPEEIDIVMSGLFKYNADDSMIIRQALALDENFTPMGFYNLLYMVSRDLVVSTVYYLNTGEEVPLPSLEILSELL